jgi:hypothetical protein
MNSSPRLLSDVGSRRVIITDEREIFNTSTVFFHAQSSDKGAADGWNEFKKGQLFIAR